MLVSLPQLWSIDTPERKSVMKHSRGKSVEGECVFCFDCTHCKWVGHLSLCRYVIGRDGAKEIYAEGGIANLNNDCEYFKQKADGEPACY